VVGLGGNTFGPPRLDEDGTRAVVAAALDLGVNFVDTAVGYGGGRSEEFIGNALRGHRHEMVIATKFNLFDLGHEGVEERIRAHLALSLARLHTDYIDLYQIHAPVPEQVEEEILAVLADLVRDGAVRAVGCCNYASWRLAEARSLSRQKGEARYATVQNYFHLFARQCEAEVLPYCDRTGASVLPYHPLGGGFLSGKYHRGQPPPPGTRGAAGSPIVRRMSTTENWDRLALLEDFAAERGRQVSELAIAWLVAKPVVGSVIAGVSSPSQLAVNVSAGGWILTPEEVATVDDIIGPIPADERPPSSGAGAQSRSGRSGGESAGL
jgi:aryl-alcohol dehydrogenase-like predicted oxidoreductase